MDRKTKENKANRNDVMKMLEGRAGDRREPEATDFTITGQRATDSGCLPVDNPA